jgi:penicillin-binding protein 2
MGLNSPGSSASALRHRFYVLSLVAAGFFLLLLGRLWYLQVVHSVEYASLSDRNRTRLIPIEPPRGSIFDRNGELLVENRPSFSVAVIRQEIEDPNRLLLRLNTLLGIPYSDLQHKYTLLKRYPPYLPAPLVNDISRDAMEILQENDLDLPGVLIKVMPVRTYTQGKRGAHLFGYTGEISESDLQNPQFAGYRPGDMVGKTGLEKHLENELRGISGERRVEVDAHGRELRLMQGFAPVPGKKVYLSIDSQLQKVAEEAFGEESGAAVAIDVETGEVLAMASRPTFDPALFSGGISLKEWNTLRDDPLKPLQNRAISGQYPPGSTFKLVTAIAALRNGAATPETTVNCSGSITIGKNNQVIRCWNRKGHGNVDLRRAIKESCDVWFYQVGLKLGIDKLAATALEMGMGQNYDFPLDSVKKGLIPTKEWKKKRFNQGWFNGETAIASIGQGYVLTTPLQLAVMTAAVANGGKVLRPQVVRRIEELSGQIIFNAAPDPFSTLDLPPSMFLAVRQGMEAVVNEAGGTGAACRIPGLRVAGKTGTAQVIQSKTAGASGDPKNLRDHALFVAYAPADKPKIAVAVIVEHGGHGGSAAAPVARAIFAQYFGLKDVVTPPLKAEAPEKPQEKPQEQVDPEIPPTELPEEVMPLPPPPDEPAGEPPSGE